MNYLCDTYNPLGPDNFEGSGENDGDQEGSAGARLACGLVQIKETDEGDEGLAIIIIVAIAAGLLVFLIILIACVCWLCGWCKCR